MFVRFCCLCCFHCSTLPNSGEAGASSTIRANLWRNPSSLQPMRTVLGRGSQRHAEAVQKATSLAGAQGAQASHLCEGVSIATNRAYQLCRPILCRWWCMHDHKYRGCAAQHSIAGRQRWRRCCRRANAANEPTAIDSGMLNGYPPNDAAMGRRRRRSETEGARWPSQFSAAAAADEGYRLAAPSKETQRRIFPRVLSG